MENPDTKLLVYMSKLGLNFTHFNICFVTNVLKL